jgi:hypothetical protein
LRRRVDSDDSARRSCSSLLVRILRPQLSAQCRGWRDRIKPLGHAFAFPALLGRCSPRYLQGTARYRSSRINRMSVRDAPFHQQKVIVATCRVRTLKNSVAKPVFGLTLQPMNSRLCASVSQFRHRSSRTGNHCSRVSPGSSSGSLCRLMIVGPAAPGLCACARRRTAYEIAQ